MSHPTTIDKYQVVEHLGSGSFGEVYRVLDRALGAEKAVKVLGVTDPAQFLSSLEEAQILKKCGHKHIVTINEANIFDVGGVRRVVLDLECTCHPFPESFLFLKQLIQRLKDKDSLWMSVVSECYNRIQCIRR